MTRHVDPQDAQLKAWLAEGLNIEAHTTNHPCPCLKQADFAQAKSTYDQCVDQIAAIPGNMPVAFRFPCMDSMNTPSPRAFQEIVNQVTAAGNFLQLSSSVCVLLTPNDQSLSRQLVYQGPDEERFRKYLAFRNFVNLVRDYPYPFLIGRLCWEFPCAVPDDWQGQQLLGPHNPQTAQDFQAFADAVAIKQGTANYVFHPNEWIGSALMTQTVDVIHRRHGSSVRFLNFRECTERLRNHLLCGQSVRDARRRQWRSIARC